MILCSNPKAQVDAHRKEIEAAIVGVLDSGWYILGQEVSRFEERFAAYIGVDHGIGVASGTDALTIALATCGVGLEDEVITVSHTAVATAAAIALVGAKPIFVDIKPDTFLMDTSQIEAAITPCTKAIVPVHIYGQAVEMDEILRIARAHGLRVVEDCAQAHGATYRGRRVGTFGDASCFSFYPTKNLGAIGDGGIVVTDDADLAEQLRHGREYGWVDRYVSHFRGWNSRLDEMQAAILSAKIGHLDADNDRRRGIASYYDEGLAGTDLVLPARATEAEHVFHLYVARSKRRDELLQHLREGEVGAAIHYPVPVHRQPAYRSSEAADLPETERATEEIISLPVYPELADDQVEQVVCRIRAFS